MTIEAMKQALEALEGLSEPYYVLKAQDALRTAIAEAEKQEPVAWICEGMSSDEKHSIDYGQEDVDALPIGTMLYTTPPAAQRQWVGLTEPELHEINPTWPAPNEHWKYQDVLEFVRAIEAKLKEKNT